MSPLLEVKAISKAFGANLVLDKIDFSVQPGEIHALVGENGAGKSTLMKIITGVYEKDEGEVLFAGERIEPKNPLEANEIGVSIIHQEFNLIPQLTIGENVFLGNQPLTKAGLIDKRRIRNRIRELSASFGIELNPDAYVRDLSVAQQQMVEIVKALNVNAKLIIMDEPTAALNQKEVRFLFKIMNVLKQEGKCVIFITHRINEIMEVTDRITVLKDGKMIGTISTADATREQIISMMVGRQIDQIFPERASRGGASFAPVLKVDGLRVKSGAPEVGFSVYPGEILTLAGLEGQGQREIIRTLFGLYKPQSVRITFDGRPAQVKKPKNAVKLGVSFLSDDRKQECLCLERTIYQNITLPVLKSISKHRLWLTAKQEKAAAKPMFQRLAVRASDIGLDVNALSGGNQQKVALARCLINKPRLLIVHEPTRGIDVNAKLEIYKLLNSLADEGVAILMVSSDLLEVLNMSDRILVIHNNGVAAEVDDVAGATEETIMSYAVGM